MEYYAIVTNKGKTKIATALQSGEKINITKFCIGDGGGKTVTPIVTMTKLVNQTWIGDVTSYEQSSDTISATTIVPASVGGFTVREMGLIDSDGDLFAVANVPDTVKDNSKGIMSTLNLTISLKLDNTDKVTFTIVDTIKDYTVCSTGASTAAKTANCKNYVLTTGSRIIVKFTNKNTADNMTLNVNNTGAKAVYADGKAVAANSLLANRPYEFVYNGSVYELVGTSVSCKINGVDFNGTKDITVTANPTVTKIDSAADLDTIKKQGEYNAAYGNTCINKPLNVRAFALKVYQSSTDNMWTQVLYPICGLEDYTSGRQFIRFYQNSTWSEWKSIAFDGHTHSEYTEKTYSVQYYCCNSNIANGLDVYDGIKSNITNTVTIKCNSNYRVGNSFCVIFENIDLFRVDDIVLYLTYNSADIASGAIYDSNENSITVDDLSADVLYKITIRETGGFKIEQFDADTICSIDTDRQLNTDNVFFVEFKNSANVSNGIKLKANYDGTNVGPHFIYDTDGKKITSVETNKLYPFKRTADGFKMMKMGS